MKSGCKANGKRPNANRQELSTEQLEILWYGFEELGGGLEAGQFIVHFDAEGEPVILEIMDAKAFLLGSLESVMNDKEASLS